MKNKSKITLLCSMVIIAALSVFTSCKDSQKLSFDELRLRQTLKATGGDLDLNDTLIIKRIEAMDKGATDIWSSMNKNADRKYLWNDRDCQDDSISPFRPASITTSLGRLSHLASAYTTKGSQYYKNDTLRQDIINGMEWMYANKWSPKYPMYGNWWDWIIGMPMSVNNMLLVMYDDFTPEQRAKYIATLDFYAPGVTYEGASTGANKLWQCYSMALRGILAHDASKIKMGIEGIDSEFKYVNTHDGFYHDGSFIQHQWHPYTGGYGASFIREIPQLIALVEGSEWEVDKSHVNMASEWIENSYLPVIYDGAVMDMVRGREIARGSGSDRAIGHSILLSSYNVVKRAPEDIKNRLLPLIKYQMQSDKCRDFVSNDVPLWQLAEIRAFLNDDKIKAQAPTPFHKQFTMMDRVVHERPAFAFGIAMSSNRIENYESIDTENMMAWHIGDGMTYLYNNDQKQFSDQYWSTTDYYRLPGTTVDVEQQHDVKSLVFGKGVLYADGYKSPKTWVGGSSLDKLYGISGMWFDDEKSSLEAQKTWFMVEDEIVALGAGINSSDNRKIETIADNRKIDGDATIIMDGKTVLASNGKIDVPSVSWIHYNSSIPGSSIGYYLPEGKNILVQKETRKGTWRAFTKYGSPDINIRDFYSIAFNHGKNPKDATYAYVLLPGKSADETKAYAKSSNIRIIANNPQVQAVNAIKQGITGFNFWEAIPEALSGVKVSAPSSVLIKETENELTIGVSDPTQQYQEKIVVDIDKNVSNVTSESPNIKVISTSPLKLEVTVKDGMGQTFAITLKK